MEYGKKYRVTYQIEGLHMVPRCGVAVCLETGPVIALHGEREFGVCHIDAKYIIKFKEVDKDAPCFMDMRVKR